MRSMQNLLEISLRSAELCSAPKNFLRLRINTRGVVVTSDTRATDPTRLILNFQLGYLMVGRKISVGRENFEREQCGRRVMQNLPEISLRSARLRSEEFPRITFWVTVRGGQTPERLTPIKLDLFLTWLLGWDGGSKNFGGSRKFR
jgi:hypothetical protein